jgi:hypothetical protein
MKEKIPQSLFGNWQVDKKQGLIPKPSSWTRNSRQMGFGYTTHPESADRLISDDVTLLQEQTNSSQDYRKWSGILEDWPKMMASCIFMQVGLTEYFESKTSIPELTPSQLLRH